MNKLSALIAFSVLLLVPAEAQNAFGGTDFTPVSIVFMGKINDCKIFKINKGVGPDEKDHLIKRVQVEILMGSIQRPTLDPTATHSSMGNFDRFDYNPDVNENPTTPQMATLTVCPISSEVVFGIQVNTEPAVQVGKLFVHEQFTDAPESDSFTFRSSFGIDKELPEDCTSKVTIGSTNVNRGTLRISCVPNEGGSIVSIIGEPINPMMPAINAVAIDPLGDTFLLVSEICILFLDDSFICPTDIGLDFRVELPTIFDDGNGQAVGGELIPLDTTMVLVAGTQSVAAWMIPVIVSAIGIGIVIARKF